MNQSSEQKYTAFSSGIKWQPPSDGDKPVAGSKVIQGNSRMADVIMRNEHLLLVIERFGISLGFGDKTVREVCEAYRLNIPLVLAVMNLFINNPVSSENRLTEDMLTDLIGYLRHAHRYFLDEKLPYINELIDRFIEHTENPDTRLLQSFFKDYAQEVDEHMQLEDETAFPYIQALYNATRGKTCDQNALHYSIDEFLEHHSDIEEKLEDLTHLLIKHFPPTKDRFYRNMILFELFALQYDLNDHGGIEEHILVPLVRQLELKWKENVR